MVCTTVQTIYDLICYNAQDPSEDRHATSETRVMYFFYVLLTVHLSIFILVINQFDAQNFCFTISLFHASTCFEHHVLVIRRSKLYYTASGIITSTGGHPVHGMATCKCVMIPEAV